MTTYDLAVTAEEDLRSIWRYTLKTWRLTRRSVILTKSKPAAKPLDKAGHSRSHLMSCRMTLGSATADIIT